MPRVVQPGGLSRKVCVRYTARRKLGLLASARHIMEEEGVSLRRTAERLQVAHNLDGDARRVGWLVGHRTRRKLYLIDFFFIQNDTPVER